ncbi:MAG TPA: hypothetical protein VNS33_05415 [Bradyrhizobium sp.]|nr:hypothetical protein [Bradyrhizobium sp.]
MWWEGKLGRAIGGVSFLALAYSEFDYASQAGLIDLSSSVAGRWRALLIMVGFVVGLTIAPPVSFMAVFGGYLLAGIGSALVFLFIAAVHWANTGEIVDNMRWFHFWFIFTLPLITAFWIWRLSKELSNVERSTAARLTIAHPLATIFCGALTFASAVLIARAKLGISWGTFFGVTLGS